MPVMEGNAENILGKHFEIRKVCDREVTDSLRSSIREFCQVGPGETTCTWVLAWGPLHAAARASASAGQIGTVEHVGRIVVRCSLALH